MLRHRVWHRRVLWPLHPRLPLLLTAFLFGNLLAVLFSIVYPETSLRQTPSYTYEQVTASNGVQLHVMQTVPQNIDLKPIATNVTKTGNYGINGGFFWQGYLLSIAVVNDQPIKGVQDGYGSGWFNIDYPKGTLVWDDITKRFTVQVVQDAHQLNVTDRHRYWAQGGVSMSLQQEELWTQQALAEDMPAFGERRLRSGAVYDDQQNLWLIVTEKPYTVEQFRTAIMEKVGRGNLRDGIFLDGDGSSQMYNKQQVLRGDSREVYQMLALKQK